MRTLKILSTAFLCLLGFVFVTPSFTAVIDNSSPYGLNDWNFTDVALTAAKESGVGWMRVMVNWAAIEGRKGVYVWDQGANDNIDFYMSQTQKYGFKVSICPYNAPEWAKIRTKYVWRDAPAYANFVRVLLQRYPGQIAALEVLNEDSTISWPNTKWRDAYYYVPILKAAYQAVKSINPSIIVTTSALWSNPVGYLEDLYVQGAKGYFDVVNFHYYPSKNSPALDYTWLISHYRKVMQKNGDGNKPIWLTEFAWPIDDEPEGRRTNDLVSPKAQSDYLNYVLDASKKSGFVKKVFWYELRGDDGMAMMHATDYFNWRTPPRLSRGISANDISLMVPGGDYRRWPQSGLVTIDAERIRYSSLNYTDNSTTLQGLIRGVDGTIAAGHTTAITTRVYNQDVTPELTSGISVGDTTLTITGNKWTTRWPSDGVLSIDSENIKYASAVLSGANTTFRGLTRGYENTAPAEHSLFTKVKNQDLTANFKRKVYYTYKNFIQASPVWDRAARLPDVPLAASAPVTITNADFEQGRGEGLLTAWTNNATIDTTVKRSGLASAKLANNTGMRIQATNFAFTAVEPNKSYFLKAWVRIDPAGSGDMNAMIEVNMQDASGKFVSGAGGLASNYFIYETAGAWREIHYPFRTPPNAAQLRIALVAEKGTGTAWFDDISIEPYDLSHRVIMGRR